MRCDAWVTRARHSNLILNIWSASSFQKSRLHWHKLKRSGLFLRYSVRCSVICNSSAMIVIPDSRVTGRVLESGWFDKFMWARYRVRLCVLLWTDMSYNQNGSNLNVTTKHHYQWKKGDSIMTKRTVTLFGDPASKDVCFWTTYCAPPSLFFLGLKQI